VPIVNAAGGAIVADDRHVVRFRAGGSVRLRSRTPGGRPISPVQTQDGTVVLATRLGPISAFDPETGKHLGTLRLRDQLGGFDGIFDTTNTPGVQGNRIYVSTEFTLPGERPDPNHHARLYAIDVDPDRPRSERLRVAWHFDFGARSGASPTVLGGKRILFDGDRSSPTSAFDPRFFLVRDRGRRPELLWESPLGGPGVASAALDPRGGAWTFAFTNPLLTRISAKDGEPLQTIDLDAAVGAPGIHVPLSAMSIASGRGGRPVMIVTARSRETTYVVALDLVRERAIWSRPIPDASLLGIPMGQFPILANGGKRTVVFAAKSGVRGLRGPK
jgi:outer membrane protein assembly factor BamB